MSLGRLVWRNVLRNKRRTGLTVLSIGFSLFLLMTLLTFRSQLLNPDFDDNSALRLITSPSTSVADMLPASYLEKIKRVPHVEHVVPLQWFNGIYKDPDYLFANFGTDPKDIFNVYTEQINARVTFLGEALETTANARPRLWIPKSAATKGATGSIVYVLVDGKAVAKPVKLGTEAEKGIEVIEGLDGAETLITAPVEQLTGGARVAATP